MCKKIYILILNITAAGGTERAVVNLANMLVPYVESVNIISLLSCDDGKPYFSLDKNIRVSHLGMGFIPVSIFGKISWYFNVRKVLSKNIEKKSVIIGTGHNINFVLSLLTERKRIACEHIQLDSIPFLHRKIMYFLYGNLDLLVVLSESAKKKLNKYNRNIKVIPNSLPFLPSSFSSLQEKRIIMVGRLSEEKGYERVVNIALYLKNNYPLWSIHIFGDGPMKQNLMNIYKENKVNDLISIHAPVKDI
ncbi:glycosyltransferase [Bacteroides caecimuris]|nr:glycosyltransferase [Bacteroides caecimuris]